MILSNGVDIDAQGGYHGSALQTASLQGHQRIVQLLLDSGADINARTPCGSLGNPLWAASYGGNCKTVRLLVARGANLNAYDDKFGNAVRAALMQEYQDIVHLPLDLGADIDDALYYASTRGQQEMVQLLLDRGADVNARNSIALRANLAKQAALPKFTSLGSITRQLLEKGADVTVKDRMGITPLHIACSSAYIPLQTGKLLVEKGADLTAPNKHGWTPLHCPSQCGHIDVVSYLLDMAKGFESTSEVGNALLRAFPPNDGIDVSLEVNVEDERDTGNELAHHAEINQPIMSYWPSSSFLLDLPDEAGRTPVLYAADRGHSRIVEMVLQYSNALNRKDFYGITPLSAAARKGHKLSLLYC
ncbi:ankyrin repeat protein [Colletotrichum musicola]|uniref:Ankyrin repeat protein n=1 Tax=Colletotrichum musicola TaxID=2175873 RepID=A0A8H6NAA6_9PEZI|nr:ankyrin repeat protein [Colletotrichum musicola]